MNFILLGGRLSKPLADEIKNQLCIAHKKLVMLDFKNANILNRLVHDKGYSYLKSINSIVIFDTAFNSLNDWEDLVELMTIYTKKDFIVVTRYANFVPDSVKARRNVLIYEQPDEISIDQVALKLNKYIKVKESQY